MFKLLFKIIVACAFVLCFLIGGGSSLKGEGSHTFYLYSKSSNAKIVTLSEENASNFLYLKSNLKGESVIFYNKNKVASLINELRARKIFIESGDDFHCEYYYSNKINDYVILKGKKVNLHVCYSKDYISVGTPIIFGSF